jgi:hypothetical protein
LGAALFLAAHGAAAAGGSKWWGLHFARYLDFPRIAFVLAAAAIVGAAIAFSWRPIHRARLAPALAAAGAFALFWILRDRLHFLGDGSVFSQLEGEWSVWANREPLSHVIASRLHELAGSLRVPVERVFEMWSCLLGAALVFVLTRADQSLGARGLLLAMGMTTAATQLFCGYIEHYPPLALVNVLMLVEMRHVVSRPRTLLIVYGLFALALLLHISSVILVPALLWATLRQLQMRRTVARALAAIELLGTALATHFIWNGIFQGISGAPSLSGYLAILARSDRFALGSTFDASSLRPPLFSAQHFFDFLNLQLLLVPIALPLALAGLARIGWRGLGARPWEVALALASGATIAAQFIFDPYLGAPRDWDTLAAGAFSTAILAASLLPDLTHTGRARVFGRGSCTGVHRGQCDSCGGGGAIRGASLGQGASRLRSGYARTPEG